MLPEMCCFSYLSLFLCSLLAVANLFSKLAFAKVSWLKGCAIYYIKIIAAPRVKHNYVRSIFISRVAVLAFFLIMYFQLMQKGA